MPTPPTGTLVERIGPYRHLVALVAAVLFLAVLSTAPDGDGEVSAGGIAAPVADLGGATTGGTTASGVPSAPGTASNTAGGPSTTPGAAGQAPSGGAGGATATTSPAGGQGGGATPQQSGGGDVPLVANCDPATGRVAIPTIYAAPCVAAHTGDNGGATSSGVTADSIRIVYYVPEVDPAVGAALAAAGAANSREDVIASFQDYVDLFAAHYNTWGRSIEVVVYDARGAADDDAAAQADAIDIATELKPFLVTAPTDGSVSNAFAQTIASRGIVCICGVSKPQELYEGSSPFLGYTTLMSSTQGYVHRADYVCKRLAGRPAEHAGFRNTPADPMSDEQRRFGFLYLDNEAREFTAGADYFEELVAGCGVQVNRIEYAFDASTLQSQASAVISRMKSDGVTSVIFSGDPIAPAIFTKEATNQRWFPEWIVTGSALTDSNLFGRTYDQEQWQRAFGISYLAALFEPTQSDPYRLHVWHHGRPPTADNVYSTIYSSVFPIFTGIHLAGPQLTPQSFQGGLFSYPPTGGGPTAPLLSYGNHGLWPRVDLTAWDDITEIWWDRTAVGPDQVGNNGTGMYRYVAGARRYLPGQLPSGPPEVFTGDAPTFFDERPASDQPPSYPSPAGA